MITYVYFIAIMFMLLIIIYSIDDQPPDKRQHLCRCGAFDHLMTDKHCSTHHVDDDEFFLSTKGLNLYHAKRANKASKFAKWKPYNPIYPNNT